MSSAVTPLDNPIGRITIPMYDDDPDCAKTAALGGAVPAAPGAPVAPGAPGGVTPPGPQGLQVGVNGFQGFNDGPVGPQLQQMGMGGPAPAGGMSAEDMKRIADLEERVVRLEAMQTKSLLDSADAPDLIMRNQMLVEEFDG